MPYRDPTPRPIGVARQIDRKIHATVDVTPGRGEEPVHPAPDRVSSPAGWRARNEPSEDQPPIGIEHGDLAEGLDRTTFVVHRDDDAAVVGSIRKEHELDGDPHLRGDRRCVVRSTPGQGDRDEQERHPSRAYAADPQRRLPLVLNDVAFQRGIGIGRAQAVSAVHDVAAPGLWDQSWEDAAKQAVETAARTVRDLRIAETVKLDLAIDDGHVALYRARVNISFKSTLSSGR